MVMSYAEFMKIDPKVQREYTSILQPMGLDSPYDMRGKCEDVSRPPPVVVSQLLLVEDWRSIYSKLPTLSIRGRKPSLLLKRGYLL